MWVRARSSSLENVVPESASGSEPKPSSLSSVSDEPFLLFQRKSPSSLCTSASIVISGAIEDMSPRSVAGTSCVVSMIGVLRSSGTGRRGTGVVEYSSACPASAPPGITSVWNPVLVVTINHAVFDGGSPPRVKLNNNQVIAIDHKDID